MTKWYWTPEQHAKYEATLSKRKKRDLHKVRSDVRAVLREIQV